MRYRYDYVDPCGYKVPSKGTKRSSSKSSVSYSLTYVYNIIVYYLFVPHMYEACEFPTTVQSMNTCTVEISARTLTNILLSEMTYQGLKYLLKRYPKYLGDWGMRAPLKEEDAKFPLCSTSSCVTSSVLVQFLYATYSQVKLVYACWVAASAICYMYMYTFRNYVSEFLRQFGTLPSAA